MKVAVLLIFSQVKNCQHQTPANFSQGLMLILGQEFFFEKNNIVRDSFFKVIHTIEAVVSIIFFEFRIDDLLSLLSGQVLQVMNLLDVPHLAFIL
jgi:hypothetical protein